MHYIVEHALNNMLKPPNVVLTPVIVKTKVVLEILKTTDSYEKPAGFSIGILFDNGSLARYSPEIIFETHWL
ncbi:hypothetical protein [Bdellovibrio reynosensis]|uniref:Uncharacterized protein n=1 Tax=Bdellovibrio reynosensis TaxID=2835041 RepID=A0ABY4C5S4_9BACT|nr:hypothetical protein [Bdellovibrio reynosensis]UOF00084.1 hypothetical protein MNR06_10260 [Bdellovibrio reynosensis]